MMSTFINPFTDFGFKRIFGQEKHKRILIGFLNALFAEELVVTDLVYRDKEQTGETQQNRTVIYDIYCTLDDGSHVIVEMQNKKAKVDRLYIIPLRNKTMKSGKVEHISNLIPIERIPADICKELLDCELRGEQFKNPFAVPEEIAFQISRVKELIEKKNEAEEELAAIKANILTSMEFLDVKTWVLNNIRLTRKLPTTRTSLNLAMLKTDHPEIDYGLYERVSNVSGSLAIAI